MWSYPDFIDKVFFILFQHSKLDMFIYIYIYILHYLNIFIIFNLITTKPMLL
jgi:hypothetical protein